jgi:nucleoside-diphosphate-sugar epimerase
MKHLFCFGFGYSAEHLAALLPRDTWKISGTTRSSASLARMAGLEVRGYLFNALTAIPADVTHVLSSVPPDAEGDPVVRKFAADLARRFEWIAYLSTTGVYGDRGGDVVTEESDLRPTSDRARRRALAESQWQPFKPHIFRLPGIYGPGRSQIEAVIDGSARRIIKPGQIFSRIHVEDIAGILAASMARPNPGRIYNVADDEPCPPQDIVTFAAALLKVTPPPEIPIEAANLSPMARSFYDDSKRVSNARIKAELGYRLKYPTYREGLKAIALTARPPAQPG